MGALQRYEDRGPWNSIRTMAFICGPRLSGRSHRLALDGAAHAARAAPAPAQLAAGDLDHLDALLAQMGVGGRVALVGDDDTRLHGEHVAAVVPLLTLGRVHVLGGGEHPDL